MDLSQDELLWINNALNEVLNGPEAIKEWEIHTRIGGHRAEVTALFQKVNDDVGGSAALNRKGDDPCPTAADPYGRGRTLRVHFRVQAGLAGVREKPVQPWPRLQPPHGHGASNGRRRD